LSRVEATQGHRCIFERSSPNDFAEQPAAADAFQRSLRSRFRQRLMPDFSAL
jgi:hypothetical protein